MTRRRVDDSVLTRQDEADKVSFGLERKLEQRLEYWLHKLTLRIALPASALIVFLIAWNRGIALLYGLVALLMSTLFIAHLAPRLNLRRVTATRTSPANAAEGDTISVEIQIHAPGQTPRYMLELTDHLPFADQEHENPLIFIDRLKKSATLHLSMRCDLRGEHTLGPLQLHSRYPLGIYQAQRTLPDSQTKILVYPTPFPIRSLPLLGSSHASVIGRQTANLAGSHNHFLGVREYRHGDSPRHVHWASTARRGTLIVKEYEHLQNTTLLLVLDLNRHSQHGTGKHSTLEYAIKIAVSIAQYALNHGHHVGLIGRGAEWVETPIGCGPRHYQNLLELLARIKAEGNTPYAEVVQKATAALVGGGILWLFEHGQSTQPASPASGRFHHGLRVQRIRFDATSFDDPGSDQPLQQKTPGEPWVREYVVHKGDDLSQLFA